MSKVVLDGEIVSFEGPPPSSCSEVWTLLEGHLGQSGFLIDRFVIDGVLWSPDGSDSRSAYGKIEVFSMTFEQNIANIVETLLNESDQLQERWQLGAARSLSQPWSQFQSEAVEILNETQPLVQSIGLLTEYSKQNQKSWSEAMGILGEKLNALLSSLMDAFEAGDCITYSDIAAKEFQVALAAVYELLSNEVIPSLDSGKSQ